MVHHICLCLLHWSVGALKLWNIRYHRENSFLCLRRKKPTDSQNTHLFLSRAELFYSSLWSCYGGTLQTNKAFLESLWCFVQNLQITSDFCILSVVFKFCSLYSFLLLWLWKNNSKYLINLLNSMEELSEVLQRGFLIQLQSIIEYCTNFSQYCCTWAYNIYSDKCWT